MSIVIIRIYLLTATENQLFCVLRLHSFSINETIIEKQMKESYEVQDNSDEYTKNHIHISLSHHKSFISQNFAHYYFRFISLMFRLHFVCLSYWPGTATWRKTSSFRRSIPPTSNITNEKPATRLKLVLWENLNLIVMESAKLFEHLEQQTWRCGGSSS